MSIEYYNQNAIAFDTVTATLDMSHLYDEFLPLLPAGGHIVDAGCGSGRDSIVFQRMGFKVSAFDASHELVSIAQNRLGVECASESTFLTFALDTQVDAIWACASLLHIPIPEISVSFAHLSGLLKSGGFFYCSFKYGDGVREQGRRHFTNMNEESLLQAISGSSLNVHKIWITNDIRSERLNEKWLNALLVKDFD